MRQKKVKKAFSLIELSIVIVIVSILVTGALSTSVTAINNAKIKVTEDRISQIYNALGVFLLKNGRLPCPASVLLTKSGTDTSYGAEKGTAGTCAGSSTGTYSSTTSTNLVYGAVPFQTLGLPIEMGEDGFESKIAYIVDKRFTSSSTFGTTTATGIITVLEKPAATSQTSTSDAIFVLVGYGANESGAYPANSASQNTPLSTDTSEQSNDAVVVVSTTTATFTDSFVASSGNSDVFDDVVFYKTRDQMLQDFNAFSLVPCTSASSTGTYYGTSITWPIGYYDQNVVATTSCPSGYLQGPSKPTRKCKAFGVWGDIINPCLS